MPDSLGAIPLSIKLKDGRALNRYEFGDPAGHPCLFLPGAGTSGLGGAALAETATNAGIRLLSLDRPGLGRSDPVPQRRLRDWPDDVEQLADVLGLHRFGLLGHSVGGAFALAVTQRLQDRIPLTVIGSGSGPYSEQWFRDSANMSRTSRQYYALAIRAPRLFGAMQMASMPRSPKAIERMLSLVSRGGSPNSLYARSHPEETRIAMSAVADGARQGSRGPTDDIRRIAQPWGFELGEVKGPVEWGHGEQDTNVDPAAGRAITARLSRVTTHFVDGGHYALYEHADEAMTSLANAR